MSLRILQDSRSVNFNSRLVPCLDVVYPDGGICNFKGEAELPGGEVPAHRPAPEPDQQNRRRLEGLEVALDDENLTLLRVVPRGTGRVVDAIVSDYADAATAAAAGTLGSEAVRLDRDSDTSSASQSIS